MKRNHEGEIEELGNRYNSLQVKSRSQKSLLLVRAFTRHKEDQTSKTKSTRNDYWKQRAEHQDLHRLSGTLFNRIKFLRNSRARCTTGRYRLAAPIANKMSSTLAASWSSKFRILFTQIIKHRIFLHLGDGSPFVFS